MDFGLSDEERMILQTVREFVRKEVAPLLPDVQKEELPVERILREVRVYRIFEGTDEIQKRSVARNLLRDYVRLDEWT